MFIRAIAVLLLCASSAAAKDNFTPARDTPIFDPARPAVAQSFSCEPRKTCGRIRSCDEAVWYLYNCSWGGRLDGDSDGAPCENLCGSNN
jgi:hypothetical protein